MKWKIRTANNSDLSGIKELADSHKHELGFVLRPAILSSISVGRVLVADTVEDIAAYIRFHHRRDLVSTVYEIIVRENVRRAGVGRLLMENLICRSREIGQVAIGLKCPEDLPANRFYSSLGFSCSGVAKGKTRRLTVWRFDLKQAGE